MNVFLDSTASELGSQNNQKNISSSTISNKQKTKYVGEKTLATGDVSKDTKVTKEKNIFNNLLKSTVVSYSVDEKKAIAVNVDGLQQKEIVIDADIEQTLLETVPQEVLFNVPVVQIPVSTQPELSSLEQEKMIESELLVKPETNVADLVKSLTDKASSFQQSLKIVGQKMEDATTPIVEESVDVLVKNNEQLVPEKVKVVADNLIKQSDITEAFGDKVTISKMPDLKNQNALQVESDVKVVLPKDSTGETVKTEDLPKVALTEEPVKDSKAPANKVSTAENNALKETVLTKESSNSSDLFQKGNNQSNQNQKNFDLNVSTKIDAKPFEIKTEQNFETSTTNSGVNILSSIKETSVQKLFTIEKPVDLANTKEIIDNIIEQAQLTQKPGATEMVIRLKPQHLGEMTVRVIAETNGTITATFHSNNPEVRAIMQEALPAIKQELSNTGLKVHDVGVYAQLGSFESFERHNQDNSQNSQFANSGNYELSKEEQELLEEMQAQRESNQSTDGGVDYRV